VELPISRKLVTKWDADVWQLMSIIMIAVVLRPESPLIYFEVLGQQTYCTALVWHAVSKLESCPTLRRRTATIA
jgi:hypothetical protein